MTLLVCLQQLPDNMLMYDLSATSTTKKTVKELREEAEKRPPEYGYEIRKSKRNYGKVELVSGFI